MRDALFEAEKCDNLVSLKCWQVPEGKEIDTIESIIFFSKLEELELCTHQKFSKDLQTQVSKNIDEIINLAAIGLKKLTLGGIINDSSCVHIGNALKTN